MSKRKERTMGPKTNNPEEFDKRRARYMKRTKARLATELLQAEHKIDELNKAIDRWQKRDNDKANRAEELMHRMHDAQRDASEQKDRAKRAEGERHLLIEAIASISKRVAPSSVFPGW